MLLIPEEINIQQKIFKIITKAYYLFPDLADKFINPLTIVFQNIALFS